eukprot:Pgem_evm1s10090
MKVKTVFNIFFATYNRRHIEGEQALVNFNQILHNTKNRKIIKTLDKNKKYGANNIKPNRTAFVTEKEINNINNEIKNNNNEITLSNNDIERRFRHKDGAMLLIKELKYRKVTTEGFACSVYYITIDDDCYKNFFVITTIPADVGNVNDYSNTKGNDGDGVVITRIVSNEQHIQPNIDEVVKLFTGQGQFPFAIGRFT